MSRALYRVSYDVVCRTRVTAVVEAADAGEALAEVRERAAERGWMGAGSYAQDGEAEVDPDSLHVALALDMPLPSNRKGLRW